MVNSQHLAEAHSMKNHRTYFKVAYSLHSFKVRFSLGLTVFRNVKTSKTKTLLPR